LRWEASTASILNPRNMKTNTEQQKIVFWGTCDDGKPRVRILMQAAVEADFEVIKCYRNPWQGVADKTQIKGPLAKAWRGARWIFSYPGLILRYIFIGEHDLIVLAYPGQLDALVIWPFAKLKKKPVYLDAFISLYDTAVVDRQVFKKRSAMAVITYWFEWLAYRAPSKVFLDTAVHARYFETLFKLPAQSIGRVYVGAEVSKFNVSIDSADKPKQFTVLFYGTIHSLVMAWRL